MKIEQIYTGCLAQGTYYIESNGEVAIIDPLREVQPYISRAEKDNGKIKYIFETHFHADFVSGHIDLAKRTGAAIIYGPTAKPGFDAVVAHDNQEFKLGNVTIKVLHTPGHTLESSCFLLIDERRKEHSLFSGDTLFLGDVGRPDLAQKAANMTKEELAALLFDSLMNKIVPLPDDVIVYPAHGAGSACGKNMSSETMDTLGHQKRTNYALNQSDKESFIKSVLEGLTTPPGYFGANVMMNKLGYEDVDDVMKHGLRAIDVFELEQVVKENGAIVLDTRPHEEFAHGFIPRSINIGLGGHFAPWVGALLVDVKQPIVLVAEPGREEESVTRLARIGFDHVHGYVKGGFAAWKELGKETDQVNRIMAEEFLEEINHNNDPIFDVRRESEYILQHVEGAINQPLAYIGEWATYLNNKKSFYLHCAGGYRSMMAASILKSKGIHNFKEVRGGFEAISAVGSGAITGGKACAIPQR